MSIIAARGLKVGQKAEHKRIFTGQDLAEFGDRDRASMKQTPSQTSPHAELPAYVRLLESR